MFTKYQGKIAFVHSTENFFGITKDTQPVTIHKRPITYNHNKQQYTVRSGVPTPNP